MTYNVLTYSNMLMVNSSNFLKDRLQHVRKVVYNFLGFKIKCVGRFTRRQRAISY